MNSCCVTWLLALVHTGMVLVAATGSGEGVESLPVAAWSVVSLTQAQSSVERTYIFTNANWWESMDHQLTTVITLLAFAHNITATPVIPYVKGMRDGIKSAYSLFGDFYDLQLLRKVQHAITLEHFKQSNDYTLLRQDQELNHTLQVPASSKIDYDHALQTTLTGVTNTALSFGMPHVDLENTDMYCSSVPGTVYISSNTKVRYVFLDHIHFYHFCTEKFMPWWYRVRMHIAPRPEYLLVADRFLSSLPKPVTVVHIRDLMDHQVVREDLEIELYARQIANAVRKAATDGTFYLSYAPTGRSVSRVASMFQIEFSETRNCNDLYNCASLVDRNLFDPPLDPQLHKTLFQTQFGRSMVELALSLRSDYFIGNIYSPSSRNIGLYRKSHGQQYQVLKGFSELRKVWRWNL